MHLIFHRDLLRLPNREYPFGAFTKQEVLHALESLKKEWVRHRGFALIAIDDAALTPEAKLELSSNACIGMVGRETQIKYGNDFRVRWSEDGQTVAATSECLLHLKKAAGFGARERPTTRQVEQQIDALLTRVGARRPPVRAVQELSAWDGRLSAA